MHREHEGTRYSVQQVVRMASKQGSDGSIHRSWRIAALLFSLQLDVVQLWADFRL